MLPAASPPPMLPAASLYRLPPPSPFLGGLIYPILTFSPLGRLLDLPRVEFRLFLEPVCFAAVASRLGPSPSAGEVRDYFTLFLSIHAPFSEVALFWRAFAPLLSGLKPPLFSALHAAVAVDHPELPELVDLFVGSGCDPLASCEGVPLLGLACAVARRRGRPSPGFDRLLALSRRPAFPAPLAPSAAPAPSAPSAPPAAPAPPVFSAGFQPLSLYWAPLSMVVGAYASGKNCPP